MRDYASSPFLVPSLARSREACSARPNRRACSQATLVEGECSHHCATLVPLYLFYDKESLNLRSGPILAVLIVLVATAKIGPDANFLTFVLVTARSWP